MDRKVFLISLLTIITWASGFAGIRASLLGGFSPGSLVLYRFLIASAVFLFYAIITRSHFKWPKKKDLLHIFILGSLGITIYHSGVTFGQQTITSGTTGMIVGSAPIFTTLIAVLILKERLEWFRWVGLFVGFIGISLITVGSSGATFVLSPEIIIFLLSTIAVSFFFVYQKTLFKRYHPIELTAYFTWAGTLPLLFYLPQLFYNLPSVTLAANMSAIYVGVFPAAIAYAAWAVALSIGNVSTVSGMLYLEPVFVIVIGWMWLNELPSLLSMFGGLIAISSVAIVNIIGHRKRNQSLH